MNRIAFIFGCTLILLIAVSAEAQSAPQPWKRYTTASGKFTVELPTVPSMTTSHSFREAIRKTREETTFGVYAEGLIYEVNVYENLEGQSLAGFIAESTHNLELGPTSELLNHGVAGRQCLYKNPATPVVDQFFVTEMRLYRFRVVGASVDDPSVKHFLSSIKIGTDEGGIVVGDGPGVPFHKDDPGEAIYVGKDLDRKARLAIKPEPSYTEAARQAGITGTVVLKVVFTSGGNVSNIHIVSGLPYGLTDRAIAAARNIKFFPAMKDGKNASMWMQLEYNFNLY